MKQLLIAVIAASLLLAACDRPEDKFVGQYDGEIDMPQELIEAVKLFAVQNGDDPDEVEAGMTGGTIAMELRGNGTCTMTKTADDKTELTHGTWTLNDDGTKITIHIVMDEDTAALMDLPNVPSRDRVLDVSEDGKTLTLEESQLGRTVITTFTRK